MNRYRNLKQICIYFFLIILFLIVICLPITTTRFDNSIEASSFLLLSLPLTLQRNIERYALWRQQIYNTLTTFILEQPFFRSFLIKYHIFLFYFRDYTLRFFEWVSQYISLPVFGIMISIVFARLGIAGYLAFFCLLFLRLEFSLVSVCRYYKTHPAQLAKHLPGVLIIKRGMWSRAGKFIEEASLNPHVQVVATATAGLVVWKCMDVWETTKAAEIATADREATTQTADKDREATSQTADKDREAENQRAKESREAEDRRADLARADAQEQFKATYEQTERHHKELLDREKKNI